MTRQAPPDDPRLPRDVTVKQVRAFVEVVSAGSYKGAADARGEDGYAHIFRLVERLEETLGRGDLVKSHGRSDITLTSVGREILPIAEQFLAVAAAFHEPETEVRFSAYPSVARQIVEQHSDLLSAETPLVLTNVDDSSRGDGGRKLALAVADMKLDLAVAPAGLFADDRVQQLGLVEIPLYSWTLRALLSDPKTRNRTELTVSELSRFRICASPKGHLSRQMLKSAFDASNKYLKVEFESTSQELLRDLAEHGANYAAVLPDDAFGRVDSTLGPRIVDASGKACSGTYSIYLRKTVGPYSQRESAVEDVASKIQDAIGNVRPSS